MDSFAFDMLDRIGAEARRLCRQRGCRRLTVRDVQFAVRLVLGHDELAAYAHRHAESRLRAWSQAAPPTTVAAPAASAAGLGDAASPAASSDTGAIEVVDGDDPFPVPAATSAPAAAAGLLRVLLSTEGPPRGPPVCLRSFERAQRAGLPPASLFLPNETRLSLGDYALLRPIYSPRANMKDVVGKVGRVTVRREAFFRLAVGRDEWLDDSVINAFAEMLNLRAPATGARVLVTNTFFMATAFYNRGRRFDAGAVERWFRDIDVPSLDRVVIPVNLSMVHWATIVANLRDRTVTWYDSLTRPGDTAHFEEDMRHGVLPWLAHRGVVRADRWPVRVAGRDTMPRQTNSKDCGVFTAWTVATLALGRTRVPFTPADIGYLRRRLAVVLVREMQFRGTLRTDFQPE